MIRLTLANGYRFPPDVWEEAKSSQLTDCRIIWKKRAINAHRLVLQQSPTLKVKVVKVEFFLLHFLNFTSSQQMFIHEGTCELKVPSKVRFSFVAVRGIIKLMYFGDLTTSRQEQADEIKRVANLLELQIRAEPMADPSPVAHSSFAGVSNLTGLGGDEGIGDSVHCSQPTPLPNRRSSIIPPPKARRTSIARPANRILTCVRYRRKKSSRPRRSLMTFGANIPCRFCPEITFYSTRARHIHELTCSFNMESREHYTCDLCGRQYLFKGNLLNHMQKRHLGGHE